MSKELLGTFELECEGDIAKDKILSFFNSKSITIKDLSLKEKTASEPKTIFIVSYVCSQESLSGLEVIKSQSLYEGNKFAIQNIQGTNTFFDTARKLIEEEKAKKVIEYRLKYEDNIRNAFMKSYVKEGIEFIDQETISKQRGVMTYMIKKIGANILRGKGIMNVSLPIYIFDCRSMLDAFAYGYKFSPYFMDKTAPQGNLERIKTSFAFMVSQLHVSVGVGKPFNPILGETFQAKVGNTEIYVEQTSHHPPVFNYYIKHPDFTGFGNSQMEANAGANSMTAVNLGKFYLKFNDGVLHRFHVPRFSMTGLMLGKRYMNFEGSIIIEDLTNNLIAVANINEDERGLFGKMFSSKKTFPDYFTGFIANTADVIHDASKNSYKVKSDNCILAKLEGEWTRYVKVDGKDYWRQGEFELPDLEKMDFVLPSDTIFREDITLLKHGFDDLAQEAKTYLEEKQRHDRNLRENNVKLMLKK